MILGSALALGSALCGGTSDFLGGTTSRRVGTMQFMLCTQSVGLVLVGGWVAISGAPIPDAAALLTAAVAGAGLMVSLVAFFQAMVVGSISIVAPISAVGVVVPIVAGVLGGERLGLAQAVGTVATIAGIVLAAGQPQDRRRVLATAGLGLALLAALGGGVCLWLISSASRGGVAWALLVVRTVSVSMLVAVACVRRTSLRPLLESQIVPRVLVCALLGFLGFSLYASATLHGQLAIVSVLASLYPAVTVMLAYRLLGERLHLAQQAGVAAVLVGVVLLSL